MNHPPSAFASVGHSCRQTMHANADMVRCDERGRWRRGKSLPLTAWKPLISSVSPGSKQGMVGGVRRARLSGFRAGIAFDGSAVGHAAEGGVGASGRPPLRSSSTGRHRLGCVGCRHADILDGSVGLVGDVRGMADPVPAHGRRQPRKLSWLTGLSSLQHWRIHVRFR